jgi:hypothetical protein
MRRLDLALRSTIALSILAIVYGCSDSTAPKKDSGSDGGGGGEKTGQLSVWTDYSSPITVSIDGNNAGATSASFTTAPSCGASGTVTVTLTPGNHSIAGAGNGHDWNGSAMVTADQCTLYKMTAPAPTTGQLSIWTDYSNPITVSVDGNNVGATSTSFPSPPTCGQTGTLTVTLPAGAHSVTGASASNNWNENANVVAGQCTLQKLAAPAPPPSSGQLSFWTDYNASISITVDGKSAGTLSTQLASAPACGATGTLTIAVAPGAHSFSASAGANSWSGNVNVAAGQCTLYKLPAPAPTSGRLSIWTDYQNAISVSVDGGSVGNLTTYFASAPTCGQAGTLTVTIAAGAHTVAGVSGQLTWSGSVNVAAGECTLFKLNAPTPPPPPSTGQLSIWTDYSSQIAVRVDGNAVGTTTTYFSSGTPSCGQAGTITITLPVGSHTITGSSGQYSWNGTANVTAGQCTLFKLNAPAQQPTGQLSIWTDYSTQIAVRVDGNAVGTTTTYFSSGTPSCGQAGTITITLPAGAHTVTGTSGQYSWNGSATVVAGQCTLFKLNAPAGSGTGQLSIWTNYSTQIAVRVDGTSVGTTTTYFSTGTPSCGQAGTITVTVPAGTHNVSGTSGQYTWNGNVTVVAGSCTLYELRSP